MVTHEHSVVRKFVMAIIGLQTKAMRFIAVIATFLLPCASLHAQANVMSPGSARGNHFTERARLIGNESLVGYDDKQKMEVIAKILKNCPSCMQVPGSDSGVVGEAPAISYFPSAAKKPKCPEAQPYYDTINAVCLSRTEIVKLGSK